MCGITSQAYPFVKWDLISFRTDRTIVFTHAEKLPIQENPGSASSAPRLVLEEDEDDTSKEKVITKTILTRSDFLQQLYIRQHIIRTLHLEILTPPPQR